MVLNLDDKYFFRVCKQGLEEFAIQLLEDPNLKLIYLFGINFNLK
jgi:hypothetical protein